MGYSMFAPTGVTHWNREKAFGGYVLYATMSGDVVRLMDLSGETIRTGRSPTA